jgi:preprotein translocase subunit SecD
VIHLALVALLACQDDAVEAHLKALSHADSAVREKAASELLKTPFDKLHLLDQRLKDPDEKVSGPVRKAMRHVLEKGLGSRKARFELRPMAGRKVMEDWVAAGADPKKPPKGHEAVAYADKVEKAAGFERDWVLVEPACITHEDIADAVAEMDMGFREAKWLIQFEIKPESADKFDTAAGELFKRAPRGHLAILLDGKIISAPTVHAERFGGKGVIQGSFTEEEARDLARILKGHWLESSMRADREKEGAAAPEKTIEAVRGLRGLDKVTIKPDGAGLDFTGFVDVEETNLISLWQALRDRGYRLVPKK